MKANFSSAKDVIYLAALTAELNIQSVQDRLEQAITESGIQQDLVHSIVRKAQRLAVGNLDKEEYEKQMGLQTIFSYIQKDQDGVHPYFFPNRTLTLDSKQLFPAKELTPNENDLFKLLEAEITSLNLQQKSLSAYSETLLGLLHVFTCTVPAVSLPQVSFYDFTRNVAGISVCLFEYLEDQEKLDEAFILADNETPIQIVAGDLSGIQGFLYDIVGRKAAKNLKGRSFYLQLLSSSILQRILNELKLFQGNVLYDSGGSFIILVSNTKVSLQKLNDLEKEITFKLFQIHKTVLSLTIGSIAISVEEMHLRALGKVMKQLFQNQLEPKKNQKFISIISSNPTLLFDPLQVEEGGIQPRDEITGEEISNRSLKNKDLYYFNLEGDRPEPVGPNEDPLSKITENIRLIERTTNEQIQLGTILKDVDYWISIDERLISLQKFEFNPCGLGVYNYIIPSKDLNENAFKNIIQNKQGRIYAINQTENFINQSLFGNQHQFGFLLYGGNKFPGDEHEPYTFSELTGMVDEDKEKRYKKKNWNYPIKKNDSIKRLGVLRMDVDNLGFLFQQGLGKQITFSEYASLSRNLDYFFKGYLNTIWSENTAFRDQTQIIYAGGDDLFIVGRWDTLIDLAKEIQARFTEWVAQNPNLTISGGISIVTHKFPIRKAADMAGWAEKTAKKHVRFLNTDQDSKENLVKANLKLNKNAFSLFGVPLHWATDEYQNGKTYHWDNEFELVENLKKELIGFLVDKEKVLSKGFLEKIKMLYWMSKKQEEQKKNESWQWIMAYDFARTKDSMKRSQNKARGFLQYLSNNVLLNKNGNESLQSAHTYFDLLYVAARWAELEYRMEPVQ